MRDFDRAQDPQPKRLGPRSRRITRASWEISRLRSHRVLALYRRMLKFREKNKLDQISDQSEKI